MSFLRRKKSEPSAPPPPVPVHEEVTAQEYILRLEREAFMALLQQPRTQERIKAMLQTGKPLRN